jgi:hypothetical protein
MQAVKAEKNYTIEFYRAMFAVNFTIGHCLMVFPLGFLKGFPLYLNNLDTILPFMAFSGYFMMAGYKKKQQMGYLEGQSAGEQALGYLKSRLMSLFPLTLLANILGFIVIKVWQDIPLSDWPVHLLNSIGELAGLFVARIGFGNPSVGKWADTAARTMQVMNAPLWFLSGIFVVGYFIYFLIAKNEKIFAGFIAPAAIILSYGSWYRLDGMPMWPDFTSIGDFQIANGMLTLFVGLSIGVLLWYPIDRLKNADWSKGMKVFMTVAQIILTATMLIRIWVPSNSAFGQWFNIGWANVHILSVFFTFLVLLNVDKCTRFPLFSSKMWKIPGRTALYIYALHYPIIVVTAMALGMKGQELNADTVSVMAPKLLMMTAIVVVASIVAGYLVMRFDEKVMLPWLKKSPWFAKKDNSVKTQ